MEYASSKLQSANHRIVQTLFIESPLVMGLSIHTVWLLSTVLFATGNAQTAESASLGACANILFVLAFSGSCFFAGFDRARITRYMRRKWVHLLVGFAGALGALCATSYVNLGITQAAGILYIAGLALLGLFGGFSTVLWGEAARRREPTVLVTATFASLATACVITPLAYDAVFAHEELFQLLLASLPLASVILMHKSQHDNESFLKPQEFVVQDDGEKKVKEGERWVETFHDLRVSKQAFALKLGRSALPFGIVMGYLAYRCIGEPSLGTNNTLAGLGDLLLLLVAVALVIALPFLLHQSELPLHVSKTLVLPFLALLFFAYGAGWPDAQAHTTSPSPAALLVMLGTIAWIYPAELTQKYRVSSMLTFGFFCGSLAVGAAASFALLQTTNAVSVCDPALMTLCVACVVIGLFSYISEEQMREISLRMTSENLSRPPEEHAEHRTPFTQRCQTVADTYLLSRRELEILVLLAKGRKAAYIQKELVIAEGTVRTHMKNIYRKTNVHSQQELMDLVDNVAEK